MLQQKKNLIITINCPIYIRPIYIILFTSIFIYNLDDILFAFCASYSDILQVKLLHIFANFIMFFFAQNVISVSL